MARLILRLVPLLMLGGLFVLVPRTPTSADQSPAFTMSPTSGPPGTNVSVSGTFPGCRVSVSYQVMFDDQVLGRGDSVLSPSVGGYAFFANLTIPGAASLGPHHINIPVKTAPCWGTLTETFTVTSGLQPTPAPTPSPLPTGGVAQLQGPTPTTSSGGIPRGAWIRPDDGAVVSGPVELAARAGSSRPVVPEISAVTFQVSTSDSTTDVACTASTPDAEFVYSCIWDPSSRSTPTGPIRLSFDVYDRAGQISRSPDAPRTITYAPVTATPVPPTPPPAPSPTAVELLPSPTPVPPTPTPSPDTSSVDAAPMPDADQPCCDPAPDTAIETSTETTPAPDPSTDTAPGEVSD